MTITISPAPVRRSVRVNAAPQRAFDAFTQDILARLATIRITRYTASGSAPTRSATASEVCGPSRNASTMPSLVTAYTPWNIQADESKSRTEGPGGASLRSNRRSLRRNESTARATRSGGSLGCASVVKSCSSGLGRRAAGYFLVASGLPMWSAATKLP